MAQSSQAGIITASGVIALLMTAIAALITSLATRRTSIATQKSQARVEVKVDETHKLVNQRFTDLTNYVIALQDQIRESGGVPAKDQSKGSVAP